MSDAKKILDKYGIKRDVEYIKIYKIEKDLIKQNRMFFKDYDGTLIEVGTPKVFAKTKELRKIKKRSEEQLATLYGEHANDGFYLEKVLEKSMNRLKVNMQSVIGDMEINKDDLPLQPMGTIVSPKESNAQNLFSNAIPATN